MYLNNDKLDKHQYKDKTSADLLHLNCNFIAPGTIESTKINFSEGCTCQQNLKYFELVNKIFSVLLGHIMDRGK